MAEGKKYTFQSADIPKRSFKYFEELKNNKELCDVTLLVGGESVTAHRIIISAVIPYFRDIFTSAKVQQDISTPNIKPDALKCLIEFAYSCEVQIDATNVRDLLAAACYLGVDEVRDACCDFLIGTLEYDNVLSIREFAHSLNCSELLKYTDCYIKRNFEKVSQTEGFMQCPLSFLKELIGKDDINVDNEKKIFEAVINWVKNSPEERGTEVPELIRKVRLPLLDPLYLTKIVEREEIIRSSVLCRDLIDEAKNYVQFPELRKSTCSFVTTSRRSQKNYEQYIYSLYGEMKFTARHFDLVKQKWYTKEAGTFFLNGESLAVVNKKIYFFYTDGTKGYDPASNCYEDLKCMRMPRTYATATALRNQIYVCGGLTGSPCDAVESFDPEKNEWRSLCFMKISCWGSSSVALGDYIFVLGGIGSNSIYDTVQRYDSVMNNWKIMSSLLTERSGAGAATLNGKIYVCGGCMFRSEPRELAVHAIAEVYDPVENKWTFVSGMTTARVFFSLLSSGGKLYALGGKGNDKRTVKSVDVYDPAYDKWINDEWMESEYPLQYAVVI